jgi:hypothetical protein
VKSSRLRAARESWLDELESTAIVLAVTLALSFGEALTRAERDIKQNWSVFRERFFERRVAMTAAEKMMIEKNLDLIFEFEKYVLEYPEITEKIPRDAVVFMKVAGEQKFNRWSARWAKRQAKKGAPLISVTVKKLGPVHSRIEGLALEHAA